MMKLIGARCRMNYGLNTLAPVLKVFNENDTARVDVQVGALFSSEAGRGQAIEC